MRLTKTMREEFVQDVVRDIKAKRPDFKGRIMRLIENVDEMLMPQSLLSMKRNEPENFQKYIDKQTLHMATFDSDAERYMDWNFGSNKHYEPQAFTKVNAERASVLTTLIEEFRKAQSGTWTRNIDCSQSGFAHSSSVILKKLSELPDLLGEIADIQIEAYRWELRVADAKEQLQNKIAQCFTRADAVIMFPDLVDYLPEPPVKVAKLPVSPAEGVMQAIKSLGVPDTKPEAVAA